VCTTTNQPDTNSPNNPNPTTKQGRSSKHSTKFSHNYVHMVTTLQTEKKIPDNSMTFPDEIAGKMSKKCTFINPNSP